MASYSVNFKELNKDTTIYISLLDESRSKMSIKIRCFIIDDGALWNITESVAKAFNQKVKIDGVGWYMRYKYCGTYIAGDFLNQIRNYYHLDNDAFRTECI